MLTTETTITTETMEVENTNFVITTFEQTVTGFCDICGEQETSHHQNLIDNGWFLGSNEHFCPTCNL